MEKVFHKAEELAGNIKDYVNIRLDAAKLQAAEKASAIIANLAGRLIAAFIFLLFIIFAGIALALGLGEWFGRIWAGFIVVSFLYLALGIIIWNMRRRIIQLPVMNALITQLFAAEDEED